LKDQRYEAIKVFAQKRKQFKIEELAEQLNVSITTIRRDVSALAKEGHLIKRYGKIIWNEQNSSDDISSEKLVFNNSREDELLMAHAAAALVEDGDYIFVESGSYCFPAFIKLINKKNVTAVTSDLKIAQHLLENQSLNTIVLGGYVWKGSFLLYGDITERELSNMHFDKYFTFPGAISTSGEVMYFDAHTGGIRTLLRKLSDKTIILAKASRVGQNAFLSIGNLSDVDIIVTDCPLDELPPISNDHVTVISVSKNNPTTT